MHRRLRAIASLSAVCCAPVAVRAAEAKPSWTIDSNGDVALDLKTGLAVATNGIVVRYADTVLSAQSGTLNHKTGEVIARGDVRLQRGVQVWSGQAIRYNLQTGEIEGDDFKSGQPPLFARGTTLVGDRKADVYVLSEGQVTTDDFERPGYRLQARTITVVPGEYLEARDATVRLGSIPIFYFPYFRRDLRNTTPRWTVTPGFRSVHGPYLLNSYNWYWDQRLDGALHLDGRLKRGVGVGPDVNYHLPRFGEGALRFYFIHDSEPGEDVQSVLNLTNRIAPDRWRFSYAHQGEWRTNLSAKAAVRWQNDNRVIRDFFESEYRQNYQPPTFVELQQRWSNFSLDLLAQPRINEFFETSERLPDVKLTGLRQRLGATPLFYESESSFGFYRREFENNLTNRFSALRADTYHQVVWPNTFFGWLNVTPRVGGRFTHYGETDGRGYPWTDENRGVFNTGAEATFKASRVWAGARSRFFEIDGLRHIVEPSLNYVFVPRPSVTPRRLPQFDYELPSTRRLPIDFPDYNAIDSIDAQDTLRLGLRNRLQTKRERGVENVAHWALYTDWRLDPRAGQGTWADLYSDLDLRPFHWLTLNSELRFGLNDGRWSEVNHTVTLAPNDRWSATFGHRFLRNVSPYGTNAASEVFIKSTGTHAFPVPGDPFTSSFGNNLFFTSLYYRFNENWGARATLHYEARDGLLEEQQYTLYRDFRSWTASFTFRVREQRDGTRDYGGAVTFSLKAFPRYSVGEDTLRPARLLGE